MSSQRVVRKPLQGHGDRCTGCSDITEKKIKRMWCVYEISKYFAKQCLALTNFEPHSSVDSVVDLRTGGRWFDPRLGQYSFQGLRIVFATGFIPLSPLSVVSTMVLWESSQWPGVNIMRSTG